MQKISFPLAVFLLASTFLYAQIKYPETKEIPVTNTYHGVDVIDDYQWLEETSNIQVKEWIDAQNSIAIKYLKKTASKYSSVQEMKALGYFDINLDNYSTDVVIEEEELKGLNFHILHPGKNAPASIYYTKEIGGDYEKLISPNSISRKDEVIFSGLYPSADSRFLAYTYNRNGSDWEEIKIVGVKHRHYFEETLTDVLTPQLTWYGQGFFYIRQNKSASERLHGQPELMYHKLDTPQSEDVKIVGTRGKGEYLQINGLPDQSIFFLKKSNEETGKNSYFYIKPESNVKGFKVLFFNIDYDMNFVAFKSDTIYATTAIEHKRHLLKLPINNTQQWTLLTPSYEKAVFTGYEFAGDKIVSSFQGENSSFLVFSDNNGKVLGEVNIPEGLSVSGLMYINRLGDFFFKVSSYTIPPVLCQLDLEKFSFKYLGKTEVSFDASNYKFMKKKFKSHDGTEVPMFIVYKDSLKSDGTTPFLLNTYGGYGTVAKPSFNPGTIYFIEKGGAYAYVNIRGGGEFGHEWAEAGRNLNKKNGILDFTYAAKYLIDSGIVKPKRIGIMGGSHGGMITGAALLEKPEYFGAAVVRVGALDILRKELTPNGEAQLNIKEYGTVEKEDEFLNMISYSPYHNIDPKINYPSTLIVTGSNDTRVEPWNSYKFAAKLQNGRNQKDPILMWTQEQAGHYGASRYLRQKEQESYIYNFLFHELTKEGDMDEKNF